MERILTYEFRTLTRKETRDETSVERLNFSLAGAQSAPKASD